MVFLCMNYPYSIRVVKANFSYVGRYNGGIFGPAVDNFFALWIAPGKCRTNPENVGLNPENVGIDRPAKFSESPTSTAFAAYPRARARKQKKQDSRNRARKPARGHPSRSPGFAGSPSFIIESPLAGTLSSPTPSTRNRLCGWSRDREYAFNRCKKQSSKKKLDQPPTLQRSGSGVSSATGGQIQAAGTQSGVGSTDFLPTTK